MMNLDVHSYDKHLNSLYKNLTALDDKNLQVPLSLSLTLKQISDKGSVLLSDTDNLKLNKVIRLFLQDNNNYDHHNDIDARELLQRVWRFVSKYEDTSCFFEQLIDILNGKCAQGRTTRLMQFYTAHMCTENDPIYAMCCLK